jgi:molybdopterin molybdotransferase
MIPVAEALEHVVSLVDPLGIEVVSIRDAAGRMLAHPVAARRSQPPFRSSAMDGYAVVAAAPGDRLQVIGEAVAGRRWEGTVGRGEAVRIFTGAPVPEGAERVIIQEDVKREGKSIVLGDSLDPGPYVRASGADFSKGDEIAPRVLRPVDLALLASMNIARVPVIRRPTVTIIATGDELMMPGEEPGPDQIIASNAFGVAAMLEDAGAEARLLPIARDTPTSLGFVLDLASEADLVITIGGASVGEHDIVAAVAEGRGLERTFHKVAMRPGKPLMAGHMGDAAMLGLPGNPVSALVCGLVFAVPMVRAMLGLGRGPVPRHSGRLAAGLDGNGQREHYMRARMTGQGLLAAERQDSSLLSVLADADALLIRPPNDAPRPAGAEVEFIPLP